MKRKKIKGQSFLEFTFAMMVLLIMIYGVVRVFRWTGIDLAEGRRAHEMLLLSGGTSAEQIDQYFYTPKGFDDAIWDDFSR